MTEGVARLPAPASRPACSRGSSRTRRPGTRCRTRAAATASFGTVNGSLPLGFACAEEEARQRRAALLAGVEGHQDRPGLLVPLLDRDRGRADQHHDRPRVLRGHRQDELAVLRASARGPRGRLPTRPCSASAGCTRPRPTGRSPPPPRPRRPPCAAARALSDVRTRLVDDAHRAERLAQPFDHGDRVGRVDPAAAVVAEVRRVGEPADDRHRLQGARVERQQPARRSSAGRCPSRRPRARAPTCSGARTSVAG